MNIARRNAQFLAAMAKLQEEQRIDAWFRSAGFVSDGRGGFTDGKADRNEQRDHQFDHDRARLDQEDWDQ